MGMLAAGTTPRRIVFTLTESAERIVGTLESPDQGATIPIDEVVQEGASVRIAVRTVSGTFRGSPSSTGDTLKGAWVQGVFLLLQLRRLPAIPEPARA